MLLRLPETPQLFPNTSRRFISLYSPSRRCKDSLLLWNVPTRRAKVQKVCIRSSSFICASSLGPVKPVRDRSLDRHIVKSNTVRFVQRLKTLLLSKPKHFLPIKDLYKFRAYLALSNSGSIRRMIHQYPTVFELFTNPTPPVPLLCVRLTPAAAALAVKEFELKSNMSVIAAAKLQKLLMLSSHRRLLLWKLVHLSPDLGLPANFRSRLCNQFPDKFKVVETSYGQALELVSWDSDLARSLPSREVDSVSLGMIVDRPLKFEHVRLRKGLNLKSRHNDYLVKFRKLPQVCPYESKVEDFPCESVEAEKRACAVVREVLAMTVEKRALIDHLTPFRKDFGLPNKLRAMLVRHPELFYVSLKGVRHSVFLVEGYDDDDGTLKEKDELLVINDKLMELVREGKPLRREEWKALAKGNANFCDSIVEIDENEELNVCYDGLDNLFDPGWL